MLVGLVIPRPLVAALEAIFKGIGDTIEESNFTGDRRTFWNMLQVYTYDEVQDDLRACKMAQSRTWRDILLIWIQPYGT